MSSTRNSEKRTTLTIPRILPNLNPNSIEDSLSSKKHRFTSKELFAKEYDTTSLTLFALLSTELPTIDPQSWAARAKFGGLYVNGARTSSDRPLLAPFSIEYYEPKYDYSDMQGFYPEFSADWIVYEDEYLAFVFKPMGIPTHPNKEQGTHSLRTSLEEYYGRKVHLPSRLDTSTSGLIPVSIHGKMHAALQHLFQRRLVRKKYLCEISHHINIAYGETYEVNAPIRRSLLHPVLREAYTPLFTEPVPESSHALTRFCFIQGERLSPSSEVPSRSFVQAIPITGRTHQIRVHLSYFFGPIVGDRFYGGLPSEALHLMCHELTLFHPMLQSELTVSLPERLCPPWAKLAAPVCSAISGGIVEAG